MYKTIALLVLLVAACGHWLCEEAGLQKPRPRPRIRAVGAKYLVEQEPADAKAGGRGDSGPTTTPR